MRALVTGGNGFVGRGIAERLHRRGDQVRILGRSPRPQALPKNIEYHQGNIENIEEIRAASNGCDTVFHVAAKVGLWGRRSEFVETNVIGTNNVIRAANEAGVRRLIFTSSPSVIFGTSSIINGDESLPYPSQHSSYYPETKAEAERSIIRANGVQGLATCALRPHLVWGPGDSHLVPRILDRARKNALFIVGNGENVVDFTFIDNVVDAHLLAADALIEHSAVAGQCYFISQDEPVRFWDFVGELLDRSSLPRPTKRLPLSIAKAIGHILEFSYEHAPLPGEPRITPFLADQLAKSHTFSSAKARRDFGYAPSVSVAEGLDRLFRSVGK